MSAISLLVEPDSEAREQRLESMLAAAPHQGDVQGRVRFAGFSCAVQGDALRGLYFNGQGLSVFLSGYLFDTRAPVQTGRALGAAQFASLWATQGLAALDQLDGAFSAVVWDERNTTLTLLVSAGCIAPLYLYRPALSAGALYVASEMRQLFAAGVDKRVNASAVAQNLCFVGSPLDLKATPFAGVERVPGGHFVELEIGGDQGYREGCFWDPYASSLSNTATAQEVLTEQFSEVLQRAVLGALPAGDTALALSGGMDSSAVYALLCEAGRGGDERAAAVHSLSYIYPGFDCDEHAYVDAIHQHWGTIGCYHDLSEVDGRVLADDWVEALEYPAVGGTSNQMFLLRDDLDAAGYKNVVMGLSGDVWMAIPRVAQADALRQGNLIKGLSEVARPHAVYLDRQPSLMRRLLTQMLLPQGNALRDWLRPTTMPSWLGSQHHGLIEAFAVHRHALSRQHGYAKAALLLLWESYWRTSPTPINVMQALASRGIQLVDPLGSRSVIDWVLSTPMHRQSGRGPKHLVREAMRGRLPESVRSKYLRTVHNADEQRKLPPQDDSLPGSEWLLGDLGVVNMDVLEQALAGDDQIAANKRRQILGMERYLRRHFG